MKMQKKFNTTGLCLPQYHYMVDISGKLEAIEKMIDAGNYFTINRSRQYGKTTTLEALRVALREKYVVLSVSFEGLGTASFYEETVFVKTFLKYLIIPELETQQIDFTESINAMKGIVDGPEEGSQLVELSKQLTDMCALSPKPIVMMIDEVDSASNNQVFLDFLAILRSQYLKRNRTAAFQSVILAGVYDVRNLKQKIRSEDQHKYNSPWNIAMNFNIDMSLSRDGIAGMLRDYEDDYHTGMDVDEIATLLRDYTSGYPFLVSRLCQLIDEEIVGTKNFATRSAAWTKAGFQEAVRSLLMEKNTLFESLIGKLTSYPELNTMLRALLFNGKSIAYNSDEPSIDMATMFGFIQNQHGIAVVANRIFEVRLYNFYLSNAEMQGLDIYKASLQDKNQFLVNGHLNMRLILEKFVMHFNELYGDSGTDFLENEGRKYFLLYLRPIINGTGNYYIESRTRDLRRTDVIVDYRGEQFIIEMKLWHGDEYNRRGEQQLVGYMEDYHKDIGYMVSFNFNKKKQIGVREIVVNGKTLIEAVV